MFEALYSGRLGGFGAETSYRLTQQRIRSPGSGGAPDSQGAVSGGLSTAPNVSGG
jgi:hypothetical protein